MKTVQSRKRRIVKATIGASALILVDAFFLNQGIYSLIVGLCAFIALPIVLWRDWKHPERQWGGTFTVGIYFAAVICVLTLNHAFNVLARERAENVIEAINSYHQHKGTFPDSLASLVPNYLTEVPQSKPVFLFGNFTYWNSESGTVLMYVGLPPFGRPYYHFDKECCGGYWGYLD